MAEELRERIAAGAGSRKSHEKATPTGADLGVVLFSRYKTALTFKPHSFKLTDNHLIKTIPTSACDIQ